MKLKTTSEEFISQLDDWEIISAYSYANSLITRKSFLAKEEFEDLSFFFFDGDSKMATLALEEAKQIYTSIFSKRHSN